MPVKPLPISLEKEWIISSNSSNSSMNLNILKIFDNDEVIQQTFKGARAQEYLERNGPKVRRSSVDSGSDKSITAAALARNNSDVFIALNSSLARKKLGIARHPSNSLRESNDSERNSSRAPSSNFAFDEPYLGDKSDASNFSLEIPFNLDRSQKSSPRTTGRRPKGMSNMLKSTADVECVERALEMLETDIKKQIIPEGGIVVYGDSEIPIEPVEAKAAEPDMSKENRKKASVVKWFKRMFQ